MIDEKELAAAKDFHSGKKGYKDQGQSLEEFKMSALINAEREENRRLREELAAAKASNRRVTLTGAQIKAALEIVNPDGDRDKEQLECELTIAYFDEALDAEDQDVMPAGYWAFFTEYPEEGRMPLDPPINAAIGGEVK